MERKILVCYATGAGSTAEVAEFIGEVLRDGEVAVDVVEASSVVAVDSYSAVVLGSSIRLGRWLPPAITFLDEFAEALIGRPIALFMTCLTIIEESDGARERALAYWEPILHMTIDLPVVGLGLFAGSLAPTLGQLPEYHEHPFGDYRDWDAIREWTDQIRPELLVGKPRSRGPLVLSGTILSYTDLTGYNLARFDFQDSELVQTRLQEANLQEADLRRANLQASDLQGADLTQAFLGWADLSEAACQGANFARANLIGANLERANLQGATLTQAILNGVTLSHANLQAANLRHADLNWANLSQCNVMEADLFNASLGWANLSDVDLSGVNLEGARYNAQTKWPLNFSPQEAGCILIESISNS